MTAVIGPEKVVGGVEKPVIPNEKLMIIACDSEMEAYFVGGVLASAPVISHVRSRMVSTQIPPSIVQHVRVPAFQQDDPLHLEIAEACRRGHQCAQLSDAAGVRLQEDTIDVSVSSMWSLELEAVVDERDSLRSNG